jgi:hypothetical protein
MKLDKDPFVRNMKIVELEEKKVLVQPSQAESTKDKDVIIGKERPPRMIKPRSPKGAQWQKTRGASHNDAQMPPLTSSWPSIRKVEPTSRVLKIGLSKIPNRTVRIP